MWQRQCYERCRAQRTQAVKQGQFLKDRAHTRHKKSNQNRSWAWVTTDNKPMNVLSWLHHQIYFMSYELLSKLKRNKDMLNRQQHDYYVSRISITFMSNIISKKTETTNFLLVQTKSRRDAPSFFLKSKPHSS